MFYASFLGCSRVFFVHLALIELGEPVMALAILFETFRDASFFEI